jgi:hypothetical protein
MKGIINKDGSLSVERKGKLQLQFCPFNKDEGGVHCGDWCPLFEEEAKVIIKITIWLHCGSEDQHCIEITRDERE